MTIVKINSPKMYYKAFVASGPPPDIGTFLFSNYTDVITSNGYNIYTYRTTNTLYSNTISFSGTKGTMYILSIAGGGAGGDGDPANGGGGAGGMLEQTIVLTGNETISLYVGAGGAATANTAGSNGSDTYVNFTNFSGNNFRSYGGGGGSRSTGNGGNGGSGGGASNRGTSTTGGTAVAGQGFRGGNAATQGGAGGGGAGGAGTDGSPYHGGIGKMCTLTGIKDSIYGTYYWAGGGGGSNETISNGGLGGGGAAGVWNTPTGGTGGGSALNKGGDGASNKGGAGGANTGGGGGGAYVSGGTAGAGGSGIIIIAVRQPSTVAIDASNLMFYYPFDTNYYDYAAYTVSYINDILATTGLSITNTTTALTTGSTTLPNGTNLDLTKRLQIPNTTFGTNGFTIAFWYKLNNTTISVTNQRLFEFAGTVATANTNNILLCFTTSNQILLYVSGSGGGTYNNSTNMSATINDTNWHHVCLTVNTSGLYTLFLDNVQKGSSSFSVYPPSNFLYSAMDLGRSQMTADNSPNANMNAFVMFNRVLTTTEIAYLYNYPKNIVFSPISVNSTLTNFPSITCKYYYPFNSDYNDYSTGSGVSNATATGSNISISTSTYKIGTGALYSSGSSYLQAGSQTITNTSGYSISLWCNIDTGNGNNNPIFMLYGDANNRIILSKTGANTLYSDVQNGASYYAATNTSFTFGVWSHVVITVDNVANKINLYTNGILSQSTTITYPSVTYNTLTFYSVNNGSNGIYTTGYIDDFRLYYGVLTPNQILQLYYYR